MSAAFASKMNFGRGVRTGWVGVALLAAVVGCGPAEDFQYLEEGEELSNALKLPATVVAVSSVESAMHAGANAVDGKMGTRWSSAFSDPQWITVDLGASKQINRVVLRWEGAYSRDFDVQISNDNSAFTTFRSVRGKTSAAVDDLSVTASGRYVRLNSLARGTAYGVSLWELEVHSADAPTTPTPTPTALPAKLEAETPARYYDTTAANQGTTGCSSTSLDAQATNDGGVGCNVGWTAAGEWLEWDVSVATSGTFDIVARLAANATGKTVHFELDGQRIGTTLTAPAAGWQAFSDVATRGISIGAGNHKLRLAIDTGDVNVNWLEVKTASTGTPPTNKDACKRGLAYGGHSSADLTTLSKGLSWWYNWDQRPEPGAASVNQGLGVEFVPMIWGASHIDRADATIPTGLRTLLGFNEPNFGSQSNLTPDRAAELWPEIEQIAAAKGIAKIASPAVNYCGGSCTDTNPINWLKRFYAACRTRYEGGCKVDYTAYHAYVCQLNWLQGKIQEFTTAHNQALSNDDPADDNDFNKPIWLTEFACGDKPSSWPSITEQNQIDYVTAALPWLESDSRIMRYAWFSGRTNAVPNANLLGASGQLTALGRAYLAQPHNASCPLKAYTP